MPEILDTKLFSTGNPPVDGSCACVCSNSPVRIKYLLNNYAAAAAILLFSHFRPVIVPSSLVIRIPHLVSGRLFVGLLVCQPDHGPISSWSVSMFVRFVAIARFSCLPSFLVDQSWQIIIIIIIDPIPTFPPLQFNPWLIGRVGPFSLMN